MKSIKDVIRERMDTRLQSVYSAIAICLSYKYQGYFVAGKRGLVKTFAANEL